MPNRIVSIFECNNFYDTSPKLMLLQSILFSFGNRLISQCVTEEGCHSLSSNISKMLFVFDGECRSTCPKYHEFLQDAEVKCRHCGDRCVLHCNGTNINSVSNLQQLNNCTHINGSLVITIEKNMKQMVNELQESLGDIRYIRGSLRIQHTSQITSLDFFTSLREIDCVGVKKDAACLAVVNNNDLHSLFNWKNRTLKIGPGNISFHYNPQLCPATIEELANYTGKMSSYYNEINVSPYSNGDQAACNIQELSIKVKDLNSTMIELEWDEMHLQQNASVVGYFVYYKIKDGDNFTVHNNRDTCNVEGWNTALVSNNSVRLENLKPYTYYVYYIKTFTNKVLMRSETRVHQFQTLSDDPSGPVNFEVSHFSLLEFAPILTFQISLSFCGLCLIQKCCLQVVAIGHDAVNLTWEPPKELNGKLKEYFLIVQLEEDNQSTIYSRNYCKQAKMPKLKSKLIDMHPKRNNTCSCAGDKFPTLNVPIDHLCAYDNDQFVSLEIIEGCEQFKYSILPHEPVTVIEKKSHRAQNVMDKRIPADQLNHTVQQLQHYSLYIFLFAACNEPRTEKRQCSEILMRSVRTLKKDEADDIPTEGMEVLVENNDSVIKWSEPRDPNVAIVTYNVEYYRTDINNAKVVKECITKAQHDKANSVYRISNLEPGSYMVRVQAESFAGRGNFTPQYKFVIAAPSKVNSVVIGVMCFFLVGMF